MKQLTQKLKNGHMQIIEVPIPSLKQGCVLVRNHYSLISAGTESSTVNAARKGYIGKAKDRPQQVKKVIDTIKSQGVSQTYRAVMKKLDAYSPLGYSCVGEVIGVAPDVSGVRIGDLVACGGFTACHSEIVCVPRHLCVALRPDVDLEQAAYNTLGAIAMQGVRQARLQLGETCAVIGLGLLGQLTALLLRASGVKVVGIDINAEAVNMAQRYCVDLGLQRDDLGIEQKIIEYSDNLGCDAVIIAAASKSSDPINFSGIIARKKAKIVVVGDVPTGFDREPHFYQKELEVKMSCSYGPGRYDPTYEEKGYDYPAGYIRWTENRNMISFQDLIYRGKVDVSYLTTHIFELENATAAYDLMVNKSTSFVGILIKYDANKRNTNEKIQARAVPIVKKQEAVRVGFIGAGSYAQSHLLPNLHRQKNVILKGVMTESGASSRSVADRFGFEFCTSNPQDIFKDKDINTIFIVSRHDSHAVYVQQALKSGKHIFVEKPLCLNADELEDITKTVAESSYAEADAQRVLMVGYNRRFSPLTSIIKKGTGPGPMSMAYRVNAGYIPPESWIQDPEIGGGRIVGEICHFIDYLSYVNGSLPVSVYASAMKNNGSLLDVLNIGLNYENGSIGTIIYYANGDVSLPKERCEISAHGNVFVLDDFKTLSSHSGGKKRIKRLVNQDKGQKSEVKLFIDTILQGGTPPISFEELYSTSLTTFKILESIRIGQRVKI